MTDCAKVGRELDLIVADKVFGIKKIYYEEFDTEHEYPCFILSGKPWRTHRIDARPIPHFSTDPTGCYNVKLKMAEKYHWIIKSSRGVGFPWIAGLTLIDKQEICGYSDFESVGDTEMEAVCRVALKVVTEDL
ncbi:MAG: hypothetical protein WC365_03620 [Candidatus Babeliales bacterium]